MICEIREDGREVVLRRPTLSDVLAMLMLLFRRDKEIVFTRPPNGNIACSFGKACIAKCIRIGDTTFLYGEGSEWDVLSALYGWDWCETRSREEREEKYRSLPWEKCIAVSIDMPE